MEMTSGVDFSGAVVHCLMLSRELARRGHNITLVCPPGSWISNQTAGDSINVILSDFHRYPAGELRRIAGLAGEISTHVIHTHSSRAHFFGVLLKLFWGVRCVATAHSCHFQPHWMLNDCIIAVSEYTRRYHRLVNWVRDKRIHVVHNFVDSKSFLNISADARLRLRQSLGFDNSSLLIGSVGQISEKKGITYLVRAMKRVFAEVPEARLVLVGNGSNDYISRIMSKAEKLGIASRIVLTGPRFDIPELLAGLDLFASASLRENFALSIIEAMAAGLPIVATAVGGVPECVGDGENGILAPPRNSEALANAIVLLLRDAERRNKMGEAGRNRALVEFSPEAKVPMIEEVLWRAAGSGGDIVPSALQNQLSRPLTDGSGRQG